MRLWRTRGVGWVVAEIAAVAATMLAAAPAVAGAARSCTITWVAAANGSWADPANWSPARSVASTDAVCLPQGSPRLQVTVDDTPAVRSLSTGDAAVVIPDGRNLRTGSLIVDGTAGLAGPGTVSTDQVTVTSGRTLALSTRAGLAATRLLVTTGQLQLRDASTLTARTATISRGGAIQGDASTAVEVAQELVGDGTATLDAPLVCGHVHVGSGVLALPQWQNTTPDGRATGVVEVDAHARLVVPYAIRVLSTGSHVTLGDGASVTTASTGRPALSGLRRIEHGRLDLSGSLTVRSDLVSSNGSVLIDHGTLTVPSLTMNGAGRVTVYAGGTVSLPDGGRITLRPADTGSPAGLDLGGTVIGDVVQNDGTVYWNPYLAAPGSSPGTIDGGWTSAPRAYTVLLVLGQSADVGHPTNLHVTGTAELHGTVYVTYPREPPAVGTSEVLVSVDGGLTASFQKVTSHVGWSISITAHAIVATYTG